MPPSRLVVLLLLLLLASSAAAAQVCAIGEFRGRPIAPRATSDPGQGLVQGQAIDIETGRPLAMVIVTLTDATTSGVKRVMTDDRGMFQFSAVTRVATKFRPYLESGVLHHSHAVRSGQVCLGALVTEPERSGD